MASYAFRLNGGAVSALAGRGMAYMRYKQAENYSVDWARDPILRFPEAPQVDVILIDRPDLPLLGADEAATAPVAAALANDRKVTAAIL
jgi:nicotinate dehydrogenase subunit B